MIDSRLVLIEGLPGSGKTTTARELHRRLSAAGISCSWHLEEGAEHPSTPRRLRRTAREPGFAERCLRSWAELVQTNGEVKHTFILEGSAFQSTIRYMLEWGCSGAEIADYAKRFESAVAPLRPRMVYLFQEDPREFMKNDVLPGRGPEWVAKVSTYLASTPFCRERGWSGTDGMIEFWLHYRDVCRDVLGDLGMPKLLVESPRSDWPRVYDRIVEWLSRGRPAKGPEVLKRSGH